ncbi:hypothetical protein C8J57DRAFT_1063467 [Mycena rebaudengoi]|nr:hypothetical protein C8J57DRAFT_1063467 [Mycena rebaudengoi]
MPSLRRTLSSPSVRTAPYPALLSAASAAPGLRNHGNGHRRSTGSETSNRRVLADIEWWRVADGQRDVVSDLDAEENDLDPDQEEDAHGAEVPVTSAAGSTDEIGAERPSTPAHWLSNPGSPEMPVDQMAALSIAPTTPRRHALESSSSSLESTPEAPDIQAEHPYLDLGALPFGLLDIVDGDIPSPVIQVGRARSGTSPPLFPVRAHSFNAFATREREYASFAYADFASSHPVFSN